MAWAAFRQAGLPRGAMLLARALYVASVLLVPAAAAPPIPIRIEAGVPQGCPLSGPAFALAVERAVRMLSSAAKAPGGAFAYADDLVLAGDDRAASPPAAAAREAFRRAAGVALKPTNCHLIPLRRHDRPREVVAERNREELARCSATWRAFEVVPAATYLGALVGPGASLAAGWAPPLGRAMARASALASRELAPAILTREFNKRATRCATYVAQFLPPPAAATKLADSAMERLLH